MPGFDPVLSSLIEDRIEWFGVVDRGNLQYICLQFAENEQSRRKTVDNCKISTANYAKKRTVTLYQSYRPEVAPQVGLEPTTLRLTVPLFDGFERVSTIICKPDLGDFCGDFCEWANSSQILVLTKFDSFYRTLS